MTRPFEGVKILDFTQVLAGPYASYQLALLGADVIKVERREGEDMRRSPLSKEWADRGLAPGWQAINGNKKSLTLDLQKKEAIEIVKRRSFSLAMQFMKMLTTTVTSTIWTLCIWATVTLPSQVVLGVLLLGKNALS